MNRKIQAVLICQVCISLSLGTLAPTIGLELAKGRNGLGLENIFESSHDFLACLLAAAMSFQAHLASHPYLASGLKWCSPQGA